MLTPSSTTTALAIPMAFMTTPPTAPVVVIEEMKSTRRGYAPRLGLSSRIWTSSAGSPLLHAHGDVAAGRSRPPTALYSIGRDFPPRAYSLFHSTGPCWSNKNGSGSDASCLSSRLLGNQQNTGPVRAGTGRRRRSSTCLGGLRKARDASGSPGDGEGPDKGASGGDRDKARQARPRGQKFYGSSLPASKRPPPEDNDIWSKHSVFEFKRCGVGRAVVGCFGWCSSLTT